jgi:hypothetical protein
MSTTNDEPGAPDGRPKISAKDVASGSAIGSATRLGVAKHKAKLAEGAAIGASGKRRPSSDRSQLMTALVVAGVMIGTLALMIVLGR